MYFGIDQFCNQVEKYKRYRLGLVTNDAAKTRSGILSRVALLQSGFTISKLFSPEHGISSTGADGVQQVNHTDTVTGVRVISLYNEHLIPTGEDLSDIDIMVFDIPDVGCRFYTYLWTMTNIMEACCAYGKPLIILDRPNPISGDMEKAEGPMLDEKECSSFIGRWNIPIRHSCTLGELATYFSASRNIDIDLTIIKFSEWNRNEIPSNNNFKFIPTSPAIRNITTAFCYPGTGLLEGISINEGRGTNFPFTIFGAPWIKKDLIQTELQKMRIPGVQFTSISYTPSDSLFAGKNCFGLSLTVTDENTYMPVYTGICIVKQLLRLFPEECTERLYKTVANPSGEKHLDKLTGILNSFQKLKAGEEIQTDIVKEWKEPIKSYLLYY